MTIATRRLGFFTPVVQGTPVFALDVSHAENWRRSIRRDGGYWMGTFSITDTIFKLSQIFYEFLGFHFEERSQGQTTWEGIAYELDLNVNGVIRRRSLDMMYNHVWSMYNDDSDNVQTSSAVQGTASINRYGRREEVLYLDGYPTAAAESRRDTYLKEYQWPYPRVVGVNRPRRDEAAELKVTVAGYAFTANWRFETAGDASTDDASTWVQEIIDTDCEFIDVGSLESNTTQVKKDTNVPMRAFDQLIEITDLGDENDTDNTPWRFYIDNQRKAYYRAIDNEPYYFLKKGGLYTAVGGNTMTNPWQVKPTVIKDLDFPAGKPNFDSFLDDARDFYASEVEFGDGLTRPLLKTDYFEESEYLAAREALRQQWEVDS